ncbi:hypothetical protein [Arthrobacter alpinus]|uniref:hypothetical protein n=1 Tax=Arthrobacter alpinus TaxID=656366 RepID=UPI000ACC3635|nr:hypothetical protein [Arthrobacter alpinus]
MFGSPTMTKTLSALADGIRDPRLRGVPDARDVHIDWIAGDRSTVAAGAEDEAAARSTA